MTSAARDRISAKRCAIDFLQIKADSTRDPDSRAAYIERIEALRRELMELKD